MRKKGMVQRVNSAIALLSYAFLYIPILILIVFSFNNQKFPTNWQGFTLAWYRELFHAKEIWQSLLTSIIVATISTSLSTMMGISFLFLRMQQKQLHKILPLFYGHLVIPETMLAISLLSYFTLFHIELGLTTLIVAHTILGLGLIIPILYVRYLQIDPHLQEASQVLGASPYQTFCKIVLPLLYPTLFGMGLLIFVLSLDDFILSYFCAGTSSQTLSLYLLSKIRLGISPSINALSTILLLLSVALAILFFSLKIRKKNTKNGSQFSWLG